MFLNFMRGKMTHIERIKKFKYRGKPLSDHMLKRSIKAMEKLIGLYEKCYTEAEVFNYCCPLCSLHCSAPNSACPWLVLTGTDECTNKSSVVANGRAPQRIRQLRRWITAYVAVLMDR